MPSKAPIIRQSNWLALIPQLIIMMVIIGIWRQIHPDYAVFLGISSYILLSFSLRNFVPKSHRKGMALVKGGYFQEAIPYFEKSYTFFSQNDWLDKYRFLTLLSASKMCYKEMALCNIAYCYGQIGNGHQARTFYQKVLDDYPQNILAKSGLNMLKAGSNHPLEDNQGVE